MDISAYDNKITVAGEFRASETKRFLATLYSRIVKRGYKNISLDFSSLGAAFQAGILPVIPIIERYRMENDCDVSLILPQDERLAALFRRTNWAHYISPNQFKKEDNRSDSHMPVQNFTDGREQSVAVDNLINIIMGSIQNLTRHQLQALEWSISEITDNVLNHAYSTGGGYVQAQTFAENKIVEFVVVDGGIGIPSSLGIREPTIALEQAIQEGVTRNHASNAGNGLFGSFEVARLSSGIFNIKSYYGTLYLTKEGDVRTRKEDVPYPGTLVHVAISCSDTKLLEQALTFSGKKHEVSFDYIEKRFEDNADNFLVRMNSECHSFGSREFGKVMYTKLNNIIGMDATKIVTFDFEGVSVISSSYADEVFGRLFLDFGPMAFGARVYFRNVDPTVRALIDRAVMQRVAKGG